MTKSKLTDYVINPYTGCQHGCIYCYADFISRFQGIKKPWGSFVYAKINQPDLLKRELEKNKPGHIWFSSVTDPYHPIESKYQITRKILEIIADSKYKDKFTIEILTKSALVMRDFDLIKKTKAELGFSLNTTSDKYAKLIEPLASPPSVRIKVLRLAKEKGIPVFGFISPVIPGITDLDKLFKELDFCDYVWIELLNTKSTVMKKIIPFLKENIPQVLDKIQDSIIEPKKYYDDLVKHARSLEKKYSLPIKEIVVHSLDR